MATGRRKKINIVAEPTRQDAAFENRAREKLEAENENVTMGDLKMILVALPQSEWLPWFALKDNHNVYADFKEKRYDRQVFNELKAYYPEAKYQSKLDNFLIRMIVKAAAALSSSTAFGDDKGKAYTAMQGNARFDDNGNWVVDRVKDDKMVIPINSEHAVMLQLFCASVELQLVRSSVIAEKRLQVVATPQLVEKNVVPDHSIPYEIKQLFSDLLILPESDEYTKAQIASAPFVWKGVAKKVLDTEVPAIGLSLPLVYFACVNKAFEVSLFSCKLEDVIYSKYPMIMKELCYNVSKAAIYRGGYFLNKFHYFNEGMRLLSNRRVGGNFPVKWCAYNTHPRVTWERSGAWSPTHAMDTKVEAVRSISDFDGIWYDININVVMLRKAAGLIVPYDSAGKGLSAVRRWAAMKQAPHFTMFVTYGPAPCLWIEACDVNPSGRAGYKFNVAAAEILWKTMPVMNIYNFGASINLLTMRMAAADEPVKMNTLSQEYFENDNPIEPVFVLEYNGGTYNWSSPSGKKYPVPGFNVHKCNIAYIPGRHMIDLPPDVNDEPETIINEHQEYYADFGVSYKHEPSAKRRAPAATAAPPDGDAEMGGVPRGAV